MSVPSTFPVAGRQRRGGSHSSSGIPNGKSPTGASPLQALLGTSPQRGTFATSPTTKSSIDKHADHSGAKKWWKRLKYDSELNADAYVVGYIESVEHPERRSGAGAWSLRVHHRLQEAPYPSFAALYPDGSVPFHRIAYFRTGQDLVWESEQHKRQQQEGSSGGPDTAAPRRSPSTSPAAPRTPTDDADDLPGCLAGLCPFLEEEEEEEEYRGEYLESPHSTEQQQDPQPSFSDLPNECWHNVLSRLCVRDLCVSARISRPIRELTATPSLWTGCHQALFGTPPPPAHPPAAVRRACRRSELRAARWLDAEASEQLLGFAGSCCLEMDESKAVSGDGCAVRLWSHQSGRRIATLQGHTGQVRCVAFDEEHIVSGDCQGVVKIWSMDELRAVRTLRGGHAGGVTCCGLLGSMPVSADEDGCICLWDVGQASQHPVVAMEAAGGVWALDSQPAAGHLVAAGHQVEVWDLGAAQKLHTLEVAQEGQEGAGWQLPSPFTCVSYAGSMLAAGCPGKVVLWDTRTQHSIGTLLHRPAAPAAPAAADGAGGAASNDDTAAAAARPAACVGVQLDEWKLVVGFSDGGASLQVYDIRAAGSRGGRGNSWVEALLELEAPAPITCFQFHDQKLLAGLEGAECLLWDFHGPASGRVEGSGGDGGSDGAHGWAGGEKKGRKKGIKVYKKEGKFPKRKHK